MLSRPRNCRHTEHIRTLSPFLSLELCSQPCSVNWLRTAIAAAYVLDTILTCEAWYSKAWYKASLDCFIADILLLFVRGVTIDGNVNVAECSFNLL
jgi:hypothetical protein